MLFRKVKLMVGSALSCVALAAGLPYVDAPLDPARSFWNDQVHYPYPPQFARVADGHGRLWELAYLDVYHGDPALKAKAPVLVLLHGRAGNSGFWGDLMDKPLAEGWRVVAIDWGHSGKSLPRNLDLPVVRDFDDVRQLVYNLLVVKLGLPRFTLLGHSLGGQVAAGFALLHPGRVERLILVAPGGLASIAPIEVKGFTFDDPELLTHPEKFMAALKAGLLPSMGATVEEIEASFYKPARFGSMPYLRRGDPLSPFIVATRAGAVNGDPREWARFQEAYAWDSLASLAECRLGDKDSLPARIVRLKVPTMLAIGLRDPIVAADSAVPAWPAPKQS